MIKSCIFDLDGVIVDTAKYHFLAWQRLAQSLGFEFTHAENERLKGVSRIESLKLILQMAGKTLSEDQFEAALVQKNAWYLESIAGIGPEEILPGVSAFLAQLKTAGMPIALGSASKNALLILERIGLRAQFDAVIDGNQVEQAKPDPEVFLKAATALGTLPAECLVFEDAEAGVQAALRANMRVVGIGAAAILNDASLVLDGFENLNLHQLLLKLEH